MRYYFRKAQRVVRKDEFTRTLRQGGCAADGILVLFALPATEDEPAKLGVTIPKKTGNAVIRNRWKRLIREAFRTQQDQLPNGYQFIVRPKKGARPSWLHIQASIPRLAAKAVARANKS